MGRYSMDKKVKHIYMLNKGLYVYGQNKVNNLTGSGRIFLLNVTPVLRKYHILRTIRHTFFFQKLPPKNVQCLI